MRALILALAIAGVAGAAIAQGSTTIWGGEVMRRNPTPMVPAGAPRQAEDAIRQGLAHPDTVKFSNVKSKEVDSVRHGSFGDPIDGPVAIICGQYSSQSDNGAYSDLSWFFAAIKRDRLLWTASNESGSPGEAYASCKGAGLAN